MRIARRACGVDEAGRGPLAGPVYAAAVILDPARRIQRPRRLEEADAGRALRARGADPRSTRWRGQSQARRSRRSTRSISCRRRCSRCSGRSGALAVAPHRALIDGLHCPRLEIDPRAIETRAIVAAMRRSSRSRRPRSSPRRRATRKWFCSGRAILSTGSSATKVTRRRSTACCSAVSDLARLPAEASRRSGCPRGAQWRRAGQRLFVAPSAAVPRAVHGFPHHRQESPALGGRREERPPGRDARPQPLVEGGSSTRPGDQAGERSVRRRAGSSPDSPGRASRRCRGCAMRAPAPGARGFADHVRTTLHREVTTSRWLAASHVSARECGTLPIQR